MPSMDDIFQRQLITRKTGSGTNREMQSVGMSFEFPRMRLNNEWACYPTRQSQVRVNYYPKINFLRRETGCLCCRSTLSNPIISISFPLESRTMRSYSVGLEYFRLSASRNVASPSVFFPGLMNDPAPGTLFVSILCFNVREGRRCRRFGEITVCKSIVCLHVFLNVFLLTDRPIPLQTTSLLFLRPVQCSELCRG